MSSKVDIFSERANLIESPSEDIFSVRSKQIQEPTQEETSPQAALRHVARSGARAGETLAGLPGDIASMGTSAISDIVQKLGGSPESANIASLLVKGLPGFSTPSSQEIRKGVTESLTGEYLKPRGKVEEIADEIVSDATALAIPVKGPKGFKLGQRLFKSLGISAGANLASEAVSAVGGGEKAKIATKLGAMMLLGSIRKGGPKKHVNKLYAEADEALKGSPKVKVTELRDSLRSMEKNLRKGLGAPTEKSVLNKIQALQNKIQGGRIGVDELVASKRSLNEEMAKVLFESPGKANQARARKLFGKVSNDISKEIEKYGKVNPKFGKAYNSAQEGFAALQQSNRVGDFVKKHAKHAAKNPLTYALVGIPGLAKKALIGASAIPAYKTAQIGFRLAKSPTLRKYYGQVLKSASQENALAMNKALKKLDDELEKEKDQK